MKCLYNGIRVNGNGTLDVLKITWSRMWSTIHICTQLSIRMNTPLTIIFILTLYQNRLMISAVECTHTYAQSVLKGSL